MRLYYCHRLLYLSFLSFFILSNLKAFSGYEGSFDSMFTETFTKYSSPKNRYNTKHEFEWSSDKHYDDFKFSRDYGSNYGSDNKWSSDNINNDFKFPRNYEDTYIRSSYKHNEFNTDTILLSILGAELIILGIYTQPYLKKLIKKWFYR